MTSLVIFENNQFKVFTEDEINEALAERFLTWEQEEVKKFDTSSWYMISNTNSELIKVQIMAKIVSSFTTKKKAIQQEYLDLSAILTRFDNHLFALQQDILSRIREAMLKYKDPSMQFIPAGTLSGNLFFIFGHNSQGFITIEADGMALRVGENGEIYRSYTVDSDLEVLSQQVLNDLVQYDKEQCHE